VLFFDVLKGVIPVLIAHLLDLPMVWVAATAFAAFLGHLYPLFFQFKGGKGVATALGGFIALSPILASVGLLTWLLVFALSRLSSLSALTAAALAPVYSLWIIDSVGARWLILLMSLMLIARHHTNIRRLISGDEEKS
jgi:glycerol-3-phosphate acyltransferase PlsY